MAWSPAPNLPFVSLPKGDPYSPSSFGPCAFSGVVRERGTESRFDWPTPFGPALTFAGSSPRAVPLRVPYTPACALFIPRPCVFFVAFCLLPFVSLNVPVGCSFPLLRELTGSHHCRYCSFFASSFALQLLLFFCTLRWAPHQPSSPRQ